MQKTNNCEMYQPSSLKHYATMSVSKYNLINNIEHDDIKNECIKNIRKHKLNKENETRLNIRIMLAEIHRLKVITNIAFDRYYMDDNKLEKLRNNPYDYYFLHFYIKNFMSDLTDGEFDEYYDPMCKIRDEYDTFNEDEKYIEERKKIFSNLIEKKNKIKKNTIEKCKNTKNSDGSDEDDSDIDDYNSDNNYEKFESSEIIKKWTNTVFLQDDKLLSYFKLAHSNNYTKILVKLDKFKYYLAKMCQLQNDYETFLKIQNLYGYDNRYTDDEYYIPYPYRKINEEFINKNYKNHYLLNDTIKKELLSKISIVV